MIQRAATEEGLWERLRQGIPEILTVDDHIRNLIRRVSGPAGPQAGAGREPPPRSRTPERTARPGRSVEPDQRQIP